MAPAALRTASFPDAPDGVSWRFEAAAAGDAVSDLRAALTILARHALFFAAQIEAPSMVIAGSDPIDAIVEAIEAGRVHTSIDIAGFGLVRLSDGDARQDDLLRVEARLFERCITISTRKSLWVPVSIDDSYAFTWQDDAARLNQPRLAACLAELHAALGGTVSPAPGELDRDAVMWQLGFALYLSPEILEREIDGAPDPELARREFGLPRGAPLTRQE